MAYSLHIERTSSNISLEDWLTAASTIGALRLRTTAYATVNPSTGEIIEIDRSPGDLEIALPQSFLSRALGKERQWEPAFFFSQGRASFRSPDNSYSAHDPIRKAAAALAKELGAAIVGDEGEEYAW
ncbi:hypothetical protein [Coralloluteibacterium thermophilus]|uniref:DUF2591 domain-containing protein n=1 Tax=Coralloluteibacterium thermophilum TaxID=2707049 RepID=A0ABV9NI23_9GAMM